VVHPYAAIARNHSRPGGAIWLDQALAKQASSATLEDLLAVYAAVRRKLGQALVEPGVEQVRALDAVGLDAPQGWSCDEVGRAALLCAALAARPGDGHPALVHTLYTKGDTHERRALLRALPLLPDPQRFASTAIEACRTNVVPVFEAIACENTYPERHFPDTAFEQLVLKALFLEVSLARVRGLAARARPELARMASDYAAERRAAGRSVPADLARIPGCEGEGA